MAVAVSCRPLTAHTCLRSQASAFEICGAQHNIGTGFSTSTSASYRCSVLALLLMQLLPDGQAGKDREPETKYVGNSISKLQIQVAT
jgi:hypothetical protein